MHLNGQHFTVSTSRYDSLRCLRSCTGNCTLLPGFLPVRFPHSKYIWRLLCHVLCHGICCFLAGNFVFYMADIFNAYTIASLFIALAVSPCCGASSDRIPTPSKISTFTDFSSNFWARTMRRLSTTTTISRAAILRCPLLFTG